MKRINCCSRAVLEFEIKNILRDLEDDQLINFEIIPNPILKGTFDLKTKYFEEVVKE